MKKHYYHEAILEVCRGHHLTIDEVYLALKKKYLCIGIATVYRNVKLLAEQ